jgi:hypothetical protein
MHVCGDNALRPPSSPMPSWLFFAAPQATLPLGYQGRQTDEVTMGGGSWTMAEDDLVDR